MNFEVKVGIKRGKARVAWLSLGFLLLPYALTATILSFDEAAGKVLTSSPALRIAESQVRQAAGLQIQSGLFPNPVAAYSVENVFGNKNWHGWDAAESRYEFGQLIELGGKRNYRIQNAKFQYYAAQADFEAKQISLLNRLSKLFLLTVAAQELLEVASDQKKIAEEVYKTVSAKVEAGKVALLQKNKAEIALSTTQISLQRAEAEFFKSKERLATLWGAICPDFEEVIYPFYEIALPKPLEHCLLNLEQNPQLVSSQMEYGAAHQNVHLAMSLAVPDVTVTLGYKTLRDTGNKGMIMGAALPLPLFNRNQGNIQQARAQTMKVEGQYQELQLLLENKLVISHKELVRAYNEAEKIQFTVLKAALESLELAQEGYKEGKFEYLDLLDSQKTLFEVKERYIQALLSYHQSKADIDYLTTLEG